MRLVCNGSGTGTRTMRTGGEDEMLKTKTLFCSQAKRGPGEGLCFVTDMIIYTNFSVGSGL